MSVSIPDDPSVIKPILAEIKKNFASNATKDINFRKEQLRNLLRYVEQNLPKLEDTLTKDLGVTGNFAAQTYVALEETKWFMNNVAKLSRPKSVETPAFLMPGQSYVIPEPLGTVLILGCWNYPYFTTIKYISQAIAAGNAVVLKPSEMAPHSSKVLKEIMEKALDQRFYRCIEGKVEVAKAIVKEPFDAIIFTGSTEKGKLIARAAAENLTPCFLELGGKSPTIVDEGADIENAALRIVQGRFMNAGQTCIAPDYIYVHESIRPAFVKRALEVVKEFFGEEPEKSKAYSRIINKFHVDRLTGLMKNTGGKIECGGPDGVKANDLYIPPTIITDVDVKSPIMQEEIFGPILPIMSFKSIDKVIEFINARPKPLSLYYYGAYFSPNKTKVLNETSSGGVVVNDSVFQLANIHYPFGGVGASGMFKLGGEEGFLRLSNMKSVLERATWNFFPFNIRYPPLTNFKEKGMENMLKNMSFPQSRVIYFLIFIIIAVIIHKFIGFGSLLPRLGGNKRGDL